MAETVERSGEWMIKMLDDGFREEKIQKGLRVKGTGRV